MDAVIYYFTGTGNSLAIAMELAAGLKADLKAMKSAVGNDGRAIPNGACLGLVFPVYNHRIPYIVKRFVDGLCGSDTGYIFAVCTYGDSPCIALEFLSKLLEMKGMRLSSGFGVKLPYNYVNPSNGIAGLFKPFVLREVPDAAQQRDFSEATKKVSAIFEAVRSRAIGPIETEHQWLEHMVDFFNLRDTLQKKVWLGIGGYKGKTDLKCLESIQLMDHGFYCDDRCIRCGTCAKICPVNNIILTSDGPMWQHHCEQCFACLHWCPRSALQFGKGTVGIRRYHHPSISLSDMLRDEHFIDRRCFPGTDNSFIT
jgi:ferredoxin